LYCFSHIVISSATYTVYICTCMFTRISLSDVEFSSLKAAPYRPSHYQLITAKAVSSAWVESLRMTVQIAMNGSRLQGP